MTFFENTQKLLTRSFSSMLINERPSTEKVQGYIASIRLSSRGTNYRETCLFFYYDAILDKITYHVTYQGNSGYKEFTLFVRDVLDRVKGGGCVTIGVPDVGLNSRIKDIAKHCNVNLMPYSGTNPEILKLVYSVGTYLDVSGKTTPEEFDMLVETVNKILKQKNVKYKGLNKNLVKVQTLVKRMYSTLSRKKTILVPANTWEEKLLSLKQGGYDNLDNRTPLVQKITTPNTWYKSDPYRYCTLGCLSQAEQIREELIKTIESFEDDGPHAILFILKTRENNFKTLDSQLLINKHTNVDAVLKWIYNKVDVLALRAGYNISIDDILHCKHRRLRIKTCLSWSGMVLDENRASVDVFEAKTPLSRKEVKYLSPKFIPYTMDLLKYGAVVLDDPLNSTTIFNYNGVLLKVIKREEGCSHTIQVLDRNLEVTSVVEDENFGDFFIRSIPSGKSATYMKIDKDSTLLNIEYEVKTSFLKRRKRESIHNLNILTFDIETYLDGEDQSIPYACGFTDGVTTLSFYITDYESPGDMLLDCIKTMLTPKYHGYTVYAHNLSGFDLNFIYKLLYNNYKVGDTISVGRDIISVTAYGDKVKGNYKSKLVFRDSLKVLPQSLRSLCDSFNVKVSKGIFPYLFVNKNNLTYKGTIPDFVFYNQDSETKRTYNKLSKNKTWNLKKETIKYMEKDLVSLHQVMHKMSIETWNLYNVNITKYSTISALAMAIFKTNFLSSDSLLTTAKGDLEKAIRSAYYGGGSDVYNPVGTNLYCYDANSLYPASMLKPLPVGIPVYSLNKDLSQLFGFVKATVTTPENCTKPTLPYRIESEDGDRLVFPVGTWTAWFFSEELKDAANVYDYKITVHESYLYQKGLDVFGEYIKKLGYIKQTSKGARRLIHKLLLNSLYGRTGMASGKDIIKVVTSDKVEQILVTHKVIDNFILTDKLEYIRYKCMPSRELCSQLGENVYDELMLKYDEKYIDVDSSPAIAAAVTAYARITMNPLKFIPGNQYYYGDTDSAFLDKPLPKYLIGNEIGQFKQEYSIINRALFISSKLYLLEIGDAIISKSRGYSGKLTGLDYLELYRGGVVHAINPRWKASLELESVKISDQTIRIASDSPKRNRIYSLGQWVATSPLSIGATGLITPTSLVYNSNTLLILYTSKSVQPVLDLAKFESIPPVSPPIIIFIPPHLITDIIYKNLPHNLKLLPLPTPLLALPIPDYIIIRMGPPLPEIIYLSGPRIIYLPPPIPKTIYNIASAKSICKSRYSKSVTVTDCTNNTAVVYNSLGETARALNANISVISRRLKNRNMTLYRDRFLITSSITYSNFLP